VRINTQGQPNRKAAGWRLVRVTGSHHHFRHPGSAALNAEEALRAHIDLSVEQGETIPEPSTLDQIVIGADIAEAARIQVGAEPPGRAVRVSITMPEDLLAAVDRYVVRTGYSRSGLLAQAVRKRMRRDYAAG
jgi:hypothetical protein